MNGSVPIERRDSAAPRYYPPTTPSGLFRTITQIVCEFNGEDAGGKSTPEQVAQRILAAVAAHDSEVQV